MRATKAVALALAMLGCGIVQLGAPAARVDVNTADAAARRDILTREQYAAAAGALTVGPPSMPEYLRGVPGP